ncbi:MAG: hypothetical protein A2147_07780 [Chloroflexi bacterium RBG_16_57_8]|nr:MAG: hypothetical protein A2147_07780 [Chloroflexi bacterium RBG_16_57_8]
MFTGFFYILKNKGVPVSITEWLTFVEALSIGHVKDLDEFYTLARAILVKSEAHYDHYDCAFEEFIEGHGSATVISEQIAGWLKGQWESILPEGSSVEGEKGFEELLRKLEERLKEQTEQHDGGSKWIGRGGTSPFGHSGRHPNGIGIGGESHGGHAAQLARERRFRNYRTDLTLDVRQMGLAMRGLRQLGRTGPEDELALPESIEATAANAGDISLIWRRRRKNAVKLLLLMDAGGSMDPFASLCDQLFSAVHSTAHFRDFRSYYFHNCIYDDLYRDAERRDTDTVSMEYLLRTLDPEYKVILVGDATMSPWELSQKYGAIDFSQRNEEPGIVWLRKLAGHFTHCVWLNPADSRSWIHPTVKAVGDIFPMFPLTIEGLGHAVKKLVVKK